MCLLYYNFNRTADFTRRYQMCLLYHIFTGQPTLLGEVRCGCAVSLFLQDCRFNWEKLDVCAVSIFKQDCLLY